MQTLSIDQFLEWGEYYAIEPWGFQADDIRGGMLNATIGRSVGAKVKPEDFMLGRIIEEPREEDPAEALARVLGVRL